MSDSSRIPSNVNLEYFRKQAKRLLRDCREGKVPAIARVRSQLPRINSLSPEEIAAQLKLGDVQHAIAREQGFPNWAALKLSDYSPVDQFLAVVRNGALALAKQHVEELPKLAQESIHAACATGDVDALRHHLEVDSSLITASRAGWPPLMYACGSQLCRLNSRFAAGILQCVMLLLERGVDPNTSVPPDGSGTPDSGSAVPAVWRAGLSSNTAVYWLLMLRGGPTRTAGEISKMMVERVPQGESMIQAFKSAFSSTEMRDMFAGMREGLKLNPPPPNHLSFANYYDRGAATAAMGPAGPDLAQRSFGLFMKHGLKPTNNAAARMPKRHSTGLPPVAARLKWRRCFWNKARTRTSCGRMAARHISLRSARATITSRALLLSHGAGTQGVRPMDRLLGACIQNDAEAANAILLAHPDLPNSLEAEDCEAIVRLAGKNKLDSVRLMAGLGFHLTSRGESGATPLHIAAWHGHADMVKLLLDVGASVNARDASYDTSPLAWAAHGSKNCRRADEDYCAVVTALIDAGADYQSTVNHWGVGAEHVCVPAVEKLIVRLL